jgi:glutamine synthetase
MARKSPSRNASFVERHDLWSAAQHRAADAVEKAIKRHKLEVVRFSFCDQHGALRGKTLIASEAVKALRNGVTMTTTLLAKDTAHKTVFPVFTEGGGLGLPEMQGAGDFMMVPDPETFRVLPWADATGWVLCDIVFANGRPVPFSTRQIARDALAALATRGYDAMFGLEVEFHLFRIEQPNLSVDAIVWPPEPPAVSLTTAGFQYLTEPRFDQVDPAIAILRRTMTALGLPVRSVELELGPSQYEFTFAPAKGLATADMMVLFRSAMKQVARRHGYLVSFMCRPRFENMFACGWHLHQSLLDAKTGANAFVSREGDEVLSPLGRHWLGGLLAHARAGTAFASPTVNGYKRYHRAYAMAPLQAIWARDNRGVMLRVMGQPGDAATHIENRIGEPLANPYLYLASQIHAGLDGLARRLEPGPSAERPYDIEAQPLPKSLAEACAALRDDECYRAAFGGPFVDYFIDIKQAEIARAQAEGVDIAGAGAVSAWEHREYFDLE